MDAELDRFKSEISLVDLAQAEYGYELIKRESSAASKVLKCGGDKIIVTRQQGHDVYFSTGDDRDNGSVIDFMQKRTGLNLGQIRKALRAWLPGSKKPAPKRPARAPEHAQEVTKDRAHVLARWASMRPYEGSYLTDERGIDPEIIESFGVRQDERGNACIPHRDGSGVIGWEAKNQGFTGFAAGGTHGFSWTSMNDGPVKKIVICEAAIDCMSHAQLLHQPGTVYVSTGGTHLNDLQREQLQRLMQNKGVQFALAMDRDPAGDKMAAEIAQMAPQGVQTVRETPRQGKDWNDTLRAVQAHQAQEEALQNERQQQRGLTR